MEHSERMERIDWARLEGLDEEEKAMRWSLIKRHGEHNLSELIREQCTEQGVTRQEAIRALYDKALVDQQPQ